MTAMFDTLKFARALRDGGQFTPEQSERLSDALSEAISGEVAARTDLEGTEARLGRKIDDLRGELGTVEGKLDRKIDDLRGELGAVEAKLDRKIDDLRGELGTVEGKLNRRIDDLEGKLDRGFKEVRADLSTEIKGVQAELKGVQAEIRGVEAKIEAAKADTLKWIVGIIGFQSVAIIGAAIVLARLLGR